VELRAHLLVKALKGHNTKAPLGGLGVKKAPTLKVGAAMKRMEKIAFGQ